MALSRLMLYLLLLFLVTNINCESNEDERISMLLSNWLPKDVFHESRRDPFEAFRPAWMPPPILKNYNYKLIDANERINISAQCMNDTDNMISSLTSGNNWALRMIDAWGKIPPGLLTGNTISIGQFDECMDLNDDKESVIPQYCLASVNPSSKFDISFNFGICFPISCSPEEIQQLLSDWLSKVPIKIPLKINQVAGCQAKENQTFYAKVTSLDIFAISFFAIWTLWIFICTVYDFQSSPESRPTFTWLRQFSLIYNGRKLFNTESPDWALEPINGIKVLSIAWVILGHRYILFYFFPTVNKAYAFHYLTDFSRLYLANAFLSVDTFFFIGGLLVTYIGLKHLHDAQYFNIPLYFLHRYIRLTPLLAIIILIQVTVFKFFGDGPYWPIATETFENGCKKHWWHLLLYVNNYVQVEAEDGATLPCIGQAWYLAVDMQLFWLTPILLFPLWLLPALGIFLCWLAVIASVIVIFVIAYINHLGPGYMNSGPPDIYSTTHARFGPYVLGMITGYYIFKNKDHFQTRDSKSMTLFWAIALAFGFGVFVSIYPFNQTDYQRHRFFEAVYLATYRHAWALFIGWIVYACVSGNGGIINQFLSWRIFIPFSRLSYAIFIVHMSVQVALLASYRYTNYLSDKIIIPLFFGDFIFSSLIAIILSLFFEAPFINLEKIIFPKSDSRERPLIRYECPSSFNTSQENIEE